MNSFLVTAIITTFILALFLHSGNALLCYNCPNANCDKNITCKGEQDTCLIIYHDVRNISTCWKHADCNVDFLAASFSVKNFRFRCCQSNLCNSAPNVTNKIVLSGAFLLTIVHMLKFLVWN